MLHGASTASLIDGAACMLQSWPLHVRPSCVGDVLVMLRLCLVVQAPSDEPVWRQLFQRHLKHHNPTIAQQASAALAE
jgi:hypothetical protein